MSDLKPCPFCGRSGLICEAWGSHWVWCPTCETTYATEIAAVEAWNTRADSAALTAAVQAEREAIIQFAEYAERVAREKSGEHWEGRSCASFAIANFVRSRGPAPAVDVKETMRPEVRAFALLMERELKANDHKPGWKRDSTRALFARLIDETRELYEAAHSDIGDADLNHRIAKEAADVANFAMMIADVCGGLDAIPAPAVDVLPSSSGTECVSGANTLRATSHAVTRDIAQADGAVDSPKVDVMAVVRRLVKAWDAEHKRPITDDEWVAGYREVCACIVALRALVSPTTGEGKNGKEDQCTTR